MGVHGYFERNGVKIYPQGDKSKSLSNVKVALRKNGSQ